jgi:hypothetical protein
MGRKLDQALNQSRIDGIRPEAPHIPAPQHQVPESSRKLGSEYGRQIRDAFSHHRALSIKWKNVPVTEPRREPPSATGDLLASSTSTSRSSGLASTDA